MHFTDIFVKRPVTATVISLFILVLGLRSFMLLPIQQYPHTENGVISVTTTYTGADPSVVAGFITTPIENSIAQASGIDCITSSSSQSVSTIQANLRLNYDSNKAVSEVNTKVNAVINQLPRGSQQPVISVSMGQTINSMYIGFYSKILASNKITDYLIRIVQPQLQAIDGVQQAEILGGRQFALRVWLDPKKLAAFHLTAVDVSTALAANDVVSAVGRTDGDMITVNLTAETGLASVEEFQKMVVKARSDALIRLSDVAKITLGSTNNDSSVSFDGQGAVYIGIKVSPSANLLDVIAKVRKVFPTIEQQLPEGLNGIIVYDGTKFVDSSIHEVEKSLIEALVIVTVVIFLFLGSVRSVLIPVIAIPLSLIGVLFIMFLLQYSINLLTLLALVLAIGLVVDDAIIIVENIHRHMEDGMKPIDAAILGARELAGPIVAITVVLIAVYVPIGFMGGLTGALFTEFAFTLAGAVAISAIIALTLSPMMCSKFLIPGVPAASANGRSDYQQDESPVHQAGSLVAWVDEKFEKLRHLYQHKLHHSLDFLPVTGVFSVIILLGIYVLIMGSNSELAPQEDQGIIIAQLTTSPNATLTQTKLYTKQLYEKVAKFPETDHVFALDGSGALNVGITGMILKPWDMRSRSSNVLQPMVQGELGKIAGGRVAAFQLPSLPGARGLPIQFIINTTDSFEKLNEVTQNFIDKVLAKNMFIFLDSDLKIDKMQTSIILDREKSSGMGLTMQDVGNVLGASVSNGYVNYFNFAGRAYQVIPQMARAERLNSSQLLNYYITTNNGMSVPLSTIATLKTRVVPETLNHFQQLNSATVMGIAFPNVTLATALNVMESVAKEVLPQGYGIDYGGQSRQYKQESNALVVTFLFALIIIFLSLSALFESFRDPLIVLVSVPMSIFGAMIFISLGIGGASLNIYTEVGLITLIGLISKHGILIVQFANDLQKEGKGKREAIEMAAGIRLRPILMTTAAMVLGVMPLITASGAGAVSRFDIGLVIATGISIGTLFTLFVVPAMYMFLAEEHKA